MVHHGGFPVPDVSLGSNPWRRGKGEENDVGRPSPTAAATVSTTSTVATTHAAADGRVDAPCCHPSTSNQRKGLPIRTTRD